MNLSSVSDYSPVSKTEATGLAKPTSFWSDGAAEETDIRQNPVHLFEQVYDNLGLNSFYDSISAEENSEGKLDHWLKEEEVKNRLEVCGEDCRVESHLSEDPYEEKEASKDELFRPSPDFKKSSGPNNRKQQQQQQQKKQSKLEYLFFLYWIGPEFGDRWRKELYKLSHILGRELAALLLLALAIETCAAIGFAIVFLLEVSTLTDFSSDFVVVCSLYTAFAVFVLLHLLIAYTFYLFTNRKGYDYTSLDNFYKVNAMHAKMLLFIFLALIIMWTQYGTEAGFHPLDSYAEKNINRHGGEHGSLKTLPAEHMPSYPCFMLVYLVAQLLVLKAVFQNHRGYIEQNGLTFAVIAATERDRANEKQRQLQLQQHQQQQQQQQQQKQ